MRLSWPANASSRPLFFRRAILSRKLGQTDLVFDVRPGFVTGSPLHTETCNLACIVYACKITSFCVQRLRFVPPWLTYRQTYSIWPTNMNSSARWANENRRLKPSENMADLLKYDSATWQKKFVTWYLQNAERATTVQGGYREVMRGCDPLRLQV